MVLSGLYHVLEIAGPAVVVDDAQVGGHIELVAHEMGVGEGVVNIALGVVGYLTVGTVEGEVNGGMLKHGCVMVGHHAAGEGLSRVFGLVVLTLIAHTARTLYLTVDAMQSWFLFPYLEVG